MPKYKLAETITAKAAEELNNYSPFLQQLLFTRGIITESDAVRFLSPDYDTELHDPFLLNDMQTAVSRIKSALTAKEKIAVYSDYDCDGIPGGVILHDLFTELGHDNFINHIPHRHYDGFGLHATAVEKLANEGVKLIITVDCGTSDIEAVDCANELGIDVIITDHHQPGESLPKAVAVVNPQVGDSYPFSGLCGAAVAFKLAQALLSEVEHSLIPGQEKWWLDMVGLATVADMVPLLDENRVFAHYGLKVLRKTRRPGLQHLLRKQRVAVQYLTEDDIGFTIGPRINAASRMDTPEDAFSMLALTDEGEASARVNHLEKLNNERKGVVATMTREAHKKLKNMDTVPTVVVLGNPEWRPSLVGLVANKIAEEFSRPAFVWGRDGNGILKGSARSGGDASVYNIMQAAKDSFLEYGGHHFSGGFSVSDEHIHNLPNNLVEAHMSLGKAVDDIPVTIVDRKMTLEDFSKAVLHEQTQLAPFGVANPKPLYEVVNVVPKEVSVFGKGKEHTKLLFETSGIAREAIAFFKTPTQFTCEPKVGESISLLAHLEQSFFMGRLQVRLRIVDIT